MQQCKSANADHLAGEQLERRGRVEHDLHHPRRLLLDHAHGDPAAVQDDRHEDEDRQAEAEQEIGAELAGVVGVGRLQVVGDGREQVRLLAGLDTQPSQSVGDCV